MSAKPTCLIVASGSPQGESVSFNTSCSFCVSVLRQSVIMCAV